MISIKKILCPADFSDFSMHALTYAVSLAQQYGSKLLLLHVVDVFMHDPAYFAPYAPDRSMFEDFEKKARTRLEEICKENIPAAITAEPIVRVGRAFVEIVRAAREMEVDLIVIATHGRTGLSHAMFGSTAEKVVRKASCPVLSFKHPDHEFVMP